MKCSVFWIFIFIFEFPDLSDMSRGCELAIWRCLLPTWYPMARQYVMCCYGSTCGHQYRRLHLSTGYYGNHASLSCYTV